MQLRRAHVQQRGWRLTDALQHLVSSLEGRYRVERLIGSGGMAVVYLAQDLRHDRKVALKLLHPELAAAIGAERFLAEIRTTANLQHPNILPLYDSGAASSPGGRLLYYVMPFVEGESLRRRLEQERQLPLADAVRITREVAEALDHAHRHGIIHRDIKPENILLHEGRAYVADFGIALAASRSDAATRLTGTGMSIGTPQYMSPEQAMGERQVTAAADIYSLGATLYEMLAGHPPFMAATGQALVAKVVTERPVPLSRIRDTVPPEVERAAMTALQKLPADRFQSAAAFAAALTNSTPVLPVERRPARRPARQLARVIAPLGVALLLGGLGGAWLIRRATARVPDESATARAVIPIADGELLSNDRMPFDISADGSELAYIGVRDGQRRVFIRPMASQSASALDGTEGAIRPFFSPDGKWVAYFAHGKLLKLPVTGGAPSVIADAPGVVSGASWGDDGAILYSLNRQTLYRVPAQGGPVDSVAAHLVTRRAPVRAGQADGLGAVRWPQLLPDHRHVLVTTVDGVGILTLASGEVRTVVPRTDVLMSQAWYSPTGHLAYDAGEGRIRLVRFDLKTLDVIGESVPAFEAFRGPGAGAVFFALSRNGTLVYVPGGFNRTLVLVDRYGRETPLPIEPRGYRFPRFSPDGQSIAVTVDPRPSRIWIVDLKRNTAEPVSPDGGHGIHAAWSADGSRIAWNYSGGIVWMRLGSGGSGAPVLTDSALQQVSAAPDDWGRDDVILASLYGLGRIGAYRVGDSAYREVIATRAWSEDAVRTRDGRWLAYSSNATGASELYVRAWEGEGTGSVVSTGGGSEPRWSPDGNWLYYRRDRSMMALPVRTGERFEVRGPPEKLFEGNWDFSQTDNWDVRAGGQFLMVRGDPAAGTRFLVVFNWFDEIRRGGAGNQ